MISSWVIGSSAIYLPVGDVPDGWVNWPTPAAIPVAVAPAMNGVGEVASQLNPGGPMLDLYPLALS